MIKKEINIPEIGTVCLIKDSKYKRMTLKLAPLTGIRLTLPGYVSFEEALRFIEQKKDWLQKNLQKIQKIENSRTVYLPHNNFSTRTYRLLMQTHDKESIQLRVADHVIRVKYPHTLPPDSEEVQAKVRRGLETVWKKEAKDYLPVRLQQLATEQKLKYSSVSISTARSKWGSCSHKNEIKLSFFLMQLPDHLIDYVLLHELAHTVHKNHQASFWNFLHTLCPDAKIKDAELKKYSTRFF